MSPVLATDEFLPATQTELCRWMGENSLGPARPIYPAGGRTAIPYGYPVRDPGITVCTTNLTKVIDYPARDMTVTVEAGMRVDELARLLAAEGQRLPIDVAQAHRATLGGVAATNASGSRRFGLGTMRDYVIGVSAVDSSGRMFKAGGRVVKNVAGYDLCKLLVGSMGTLAVITELTLKLRPLPETSLILWITFDRLGTIDEALERLSKSAARPVAVDVLEPNAAVAIAGDAVLDLPCHRPVLCLGVEGAPRETDWQVTTLKAELAPFGPHQIVPITGNEATKLWFALAEFQVPSDDPLTFKANLLPSRTIEFVHEAERAGCALQAHAASGIVIGYLPDTVTSVGAAQALCAKLRSLARKNHGNLCVIHCDESWKSELPIFGTPEPAWPLMRKIKRELDPQNLLNPHQVL